LRPLTAPLPGAMAAPGSECSEANVSRDAVFIAPIRRRNSVGLYTAPSNSRHLRTQPNSVPHTAVNLLGEGRVPQSLEILTPKMKWFGITGRYVISQIATLHWSALLVACKQTEYDILSDTERLSNNAKM